MIIHVRLLRFISNSDILFNGFLVESFKCSFVLKQHWNVALFICFIRLGLSVALTHQNRSYPDSETKENVETQKRKQIWGNDRKRTATTKNMNKT